METQALTELYKFVYFSLQRNLAGLTHEESLRAPEPAGNSINWVLGHILDSRNAVLKMVGAEPVWNQESAQRYKRGSAPLGEGDTPERFEVLWEEMGRASDRMLAALAALPADKLAEVGEDGRTFAQRLAFLGFHEAYHAGQVGLLRRLLGHPGAIG